MNRIALKDADELSRLELKQELNFRLFETPEKPAHRSTFVPLHYERNYAYPLLIWLHSSGSDEQQLKQIMPKVSLRNFVAVAPRGMKDAESARTTWCQSLAGIEFAWDSVWQCMTRARKRFNIADNRVFIAGHGEGGTMAMRLAFSHPDHFAGVATLGGSFPRGLRPLGRISESRDLSVLLAHNRDGETYSESQACHDIRLLHSTGVSIMLRQYPGPDEINAVMLRDLNCWLMQEITGQDQFPKATNFFGSDPLN